jgi:hypothetical protein
MIGTLPAVAAVSDENDLPYTLLTSFTFDHRKLVSLRLFGLDEVPNCNCSSDCLSHADRLRRRPSLEDVSDIGSEVY